VPSYLHPGVYLEEVAPEMGPKPGVRQRLPTFDENAARLSTPRWVPEHTHVAFLGFAVQGPIDVPTWVRSWPQFLATFGESVDGGLLHLAVRGFFANGGQSCVVVRVNTSLGDLVKSFVGNSDDGTGLAALAVLDDVSIVCIPDLMGAYQAGTIGADEVAAVQLGMIGHCESTGDRIAILDCPPGLDVQQVRDWRSYVGRYDSSYAIMYYPWIRAYDADSGSFRYVPPCGHIAGVYAKVDLMRGFHHTPANQGVDGAVGVETTLTGWDQDLLNPIGVNALIVSSGRGVLVWGSRTLSSDPARWYIHRQRLIAFILRNIRMGTRWAIFERTDDPTLPQRLMAQIRDFLNLLWRSGALWGETPEEAFEVGYEDIPEVRDARCLYIYCSVTVSRDLTSDFRLVYFCDG
jgi:hypothetical protein